MKVRQDAWSHEDDVLLAETVLRHIREGSTQLRAFDEVGDILNRTSAACGFRWNAVVRSRYVKEIEEAKRERKERKRAASLSYYQTPKTSPRPIIINGKDELTLDVVIEFLKNLNQSNSQVNEALKKENEELKRRYQELEKEMQKLKQETSIIEEDYQSLISIMNRARKMAMLEDDDLVSNVKFKMDKTGNLERIAK